MSHEIVWSDNAKRGLRISQSDYEDLRAGGGRKTVAAILRSVAQLAQFPRRAPVHPRLEDPSIRRLVIKSHIVVYRVWDDPPTVQILAVRHGRQLGLSIEDVEQI